MRIGGLGVAAAATGQVLVENVYFRAFQQCLSLVEEGSGNIVAWERHTSIVFHMPIAVVEIQACLVTEGMQIGGSEKAWTANSVPAAGMSEIGRQGLRSSAFPPQTWHSGYQNQSVRPF